MSSLVACFRVALVACIAVGGLVLGLPKAGADEPAVAHGSGDSEFSLSGVSCVNSSDCIAVGSYATRSGASAPFSEKWNGTSWNSIPVSAPRYSALFDVACLSASDCLTVGTTRHGTLAETWNGSEWKIVPSPAPTGALDSELASVSCVSAEHCSAVGSYANASSKFLTLAAAWNGTKWARVVSPDPSGVTGSGLSSVSCARATSCVAVGESFNSAGNTHTLAETWNGTKWTLVPSADKRPGQENELDSVSCTGATDCIAVGSYFARSGNNFPLIEKWNGSGWTIVADPPDAGELVGVDCSSSTACAAVGFSSGTFTEMLSGSTWRVVKSPNPKRVGDSSVLAGVSCAGTKSCKAVGFDTGEASDTTYNLIESWNGSQWKIVKSARP
jgi:hypothetical protein